MNHNSNKNCNQKACGASRLNSGTNKMAHNLDFKKKRYVVLSPDGFTIHPTDTYKSIVQAKKAFDIWKEGFKRQGYYSSNNGRIKLKDLESFCTLKEVQTDTTNQSIQNCGASR